MEHFLEAFYALFPSRQGKLCCHTCYRSTRFWNVIGAKSGECSKCSARKRRTPRSLRSSVIQDRQRNEFIRSFIAIFIAFKTEIGYVNLTMNRYTIVWNSGRGYFERLVKKPDFFRVESGSLSRLAPHRFPRW